MKSKMNHSNAFVLEILLDILLFSILLTVALNMLIKAHHLTNQTKELHNAVSICSDIADIYEVGSGDFSEIQELFPEAKGTDSYITIYYDKEFKASSKENAEYILTAAIVSEDEINFAGSAIDIVFSDIDSNEIYTLRACHFNGLAMQEYEETEVVAYVL